MKKSVGYIKKKLSLRSQSGRKSAVQIFGERNQELQRLMN